MLNDYINENENNLNEKEAAEDNLDKLKFRLKGSKTVKDVKDELLNFLARNNVDTEVRSKLLEIADGFNENTDSYKAQKELEEYLSNYLEEKKENYDKSNSEVIDVKQELIDDVSKDLESVNIKLEGDPDSIIDSINSRDDVYKLKDNVSNTVDYFEKRDDAIGEENNKEIEISVDSLEDAIDSSNNKLILNTALEEQESSLDYNLVDSIYAKDNGTIELKGNNKDKESLNFAAMMTALLVTTTNALKDNIKLDMKLIKEITDISKFKIIYGNFPIENHPENKLDPIIISKIHEMAKGYNPNVNYLELLSKSSPEVATSLEIINKHILDDTGAFQMAVKNGGQNSEIMFAMDDNYSEVVNAFYESGAMVSQDANDNSIVRPNNTTPGEQLVILNATLENLDELKLEKENGESLTNNYQKILKLDNDKLGETANISNSLLPVLVIANIILLVLFILIIMK